jgi:hypothetical protein
MVNPVVFIMNDITYERKAILAYLDSHHMVPITNEPINTICILKNFFCGLDLDIAVGHQLTIDYSKLLVANNAIKSSINRQYNSVISEEPLMKNNC